MSATILYLEDSLRQTGHTKAWLSRMSGISTKHINQLFHGFAPISVPVALKLEYAMGPYLDAADLMAMQAREQVRLAREHFKP
jgi:plasmid maintenance system antidote protein VapI